MTVNKAGITLTWNSYSGADFFSFKSVSWGFCDAMGLVCTSQYIRWWQCIFRWLQTFDNRWYKTLLSKLVCVLLILVPARISRMALSTWWILRQYVFQEWAFQLVKQTTNSFSWHSVNSFIINLVWSITNLNEIWSLFSRSSQSHREIDGHRYILVSLGCHNKYQKQQKSLPQSGN